MEISEPIYGACSVSFVALIALMLLRGRSSWVGAMLLGAGAINAVWAADLAIPTLFPDLLSGIFDGVRLSAWVIFAVALVALRTGRKNRLAFLPLFGAVAFAAVLVGIDVGMLAQPQL